MRFYQRVLKRVRSRSVIHVTVLVFCALVTLLHTPVVVYAAHHPVISRTDSSVAQGETVHDVAVIGHDVRVAGTVTDNLVVIQGDVYLASTARVDTLIDIGGTVHREIGARVNSTLAISFSNALLNSTVIGGAVLAFLTVLRLTFSAVLVLLPVLCAVALEPWLGTPHVLLQKSMRRMGGIGVLATIGTLALAAGLSVTIIGIPIAAVICIVYLFVGLIGLTSISVFVGKALLDAFTKRYPIWMQSLIGATLVMAFSNVPLLGAIIMACVWIVGIGTATTWLWRVVQSWRGNRPRQRG